MAKILPVKHPILVGIKSIPQYEFVKNTPPLPKFHFENVYVKIDQNHQQFKLGTLSHHFDRKTDFHHLWTLNEGPYPLRLASLKVINWSP